MLGLPSEPFVFSNCMLSNIILSRIIPTHCRGISPISTTKWLMIIMEKSHAFRRYLLIKDNLGPQSNTQLKLEASL